MTREETIQVLKNTAWLGSNEDREATEEAIDMAIEALSEETSTINEKHQLSEETPTDLISRADAIEAVAQQWLFEASAESPYVNDDDICTCMDATTEAVQRGW